MHKRHLVLMVILSLLLAGAKIFAQADVLEGRWLFQSVDEKGSKNPLFIAEILKKDSNFELVIAASSAPFQVSVEVFKVEGSSFELVMSGSDQSQRLVFSGKAEAGLLTGKAKVSGMERDFIAEKTQLKSLKKQEPLGREDLEGFRKASQLKDPQEKIKALRFFLEMNPGSGYREAAHIEIFNTLLIINADPESVREAAETAVARASDPARVMNSIAYNLVSKGLLLDLAEDYSRKAVEKTSSGSPTRVLYLDTLGWVLFHRGQLDEAGQYLEEALRRAPQQWEIAFHLARVREATGQLETARDLYLKTYVNSGKLEARQRLEEVLGKLEGSPARLHALVDEEFAKKPAPFQAGKSRITAPQRTVLAELFTGSECLPCQASDLAFDGLLKHFNSEAVAVLEYHVHVPAPDPLANSDSLARAKYYEIGAAPAAVFGGRERRAGGGPSHMAGNIFGEYRALIEKQFNRPPGIKLVVEATRDGDQVAGHARIEFTNAAAPLRPLRLRVALLEETVHYTGANGIHFHHHVVRKMLGGAQGFVIGPTGSLEFPIQQNLLELESELQHYLEGYQTEQKKNFRELIYTLDRNRLLVAAFVQDEQTKEVLNSVLVRLN